MLLPPTNPPDRAIDPGRRAPSSPAAGASRQPPLPTAAGADRTAPRRSRLPVRSLAASRGGLRARSAPPVEAHPRAPTDAPTSSPSRSTRRSCARTSRPSSTRRRPPEQLRDSEDLLIALGLLPGGRLAPRRMTLDFQAGQVAGYYSPDKDELFVVRRSGGARAGRGGHLRPRVHPPAPGPALRPRRPRPRRRRPERPLARRGWRSSRATPSPSRRPG